MKKFILLIVLSIIIISINTAQILADGVPKKAFEVIKLAEGIHAFVWKEPLQNPIEGNSLFIINDNDVVIVDSGGLPSTARLMAEELKKLTSKPVRYVITTHWHEDHHYGNQVYKELWPDVEFIAHQNTRKDMFAHSYKELPDDIVNMEQTIAKLNDWLKDGKDDQGNIIDDARRKRIIDYIETTRSNAQEFKTLKQTPPQLTFVDHLDLYRGERTINIRWLGLGNTRGDTIIFLPKEKIVATGDLLVYPTPFAFGSYYEEWINTLGKVDALDANILFLGHGTIQRDREYLHQVQNLLKDLVKEVKAAVNIGATLAETQEKVTLTAWRQKLAGDDKTKQYAFDNFFIKPAVERAWRQAKGEPDKE